MHRQGHRQKLPMFKFQFLRDCIVTSSLLLFHALLRNVVKNEFVLVYASQFVMTKSLPSQFHCCDANQLEKDQRSISLVPKLKPLGAHLATPDASWDFLQVVLARTFVALSPAKIHCWPMAARLNEKPSIHKQQFRRKLCS